MLDFMEWMKTFSGNPVADENTAGGRTLIPREQKKFSRRASESEKPPATEKTPGLAGEPEVVGEEVGSTVDDKGADATPATRPTPPELPSMERKRRAVGQESRSPTVVLLTQFLVFALIVGSFFLGRATVSRPSAVSATPAPANAGGEKAPVLLPPELVAKVDQANAAETAGDYKRARELLGEVQQAGGRIDGLDFHLAELAYAAHDWPAVLPLLNASILEGEKVANAYNLRGTVIGQRSGLAKGLADLQLATELDPFDAKFAFFVGESLRRQGKPQAAQPYLRRALDRLSDPAQEEFYRLKLRLAQIESGQEQLFAGELAAKLAMNPPPIDWLFTAAAEELHRGNVPAAAGDLAKAQSLYTPTEMNARLSDYYFYSFADNKELASIFQSLGHPAPSPSATASLGPALKLSPLDTPAPGTLPKLP